VKTVFGKVRIKSYTLVGLEFEKVTYFKFQLMSHIWSFLVSNQL